MLLSDLIATCFCAEKAELTMSLRRSLNTTARPRAGRWLSLRRWLADQQNAWGFRYMSLDLEHLLRIEEIERIHSDPFDRLLVSQAIVENVGILTPDPWIAKYPVEVIW